MSAEIAGFATSLTVKVTLILAAGLLGRAMMRRFSSEVRQLVVLVSLGSAVMLPLALAVAPRWSLSVLPTRNAARIAGAEPVAAATPTTKRAASMSAHVQTPQSRVSPQEARSFSPARGESASEALWLAFTIIVWGLGALAVALRIVVGQRRLVRIAKQAGVPDDAAWQPMLDAERQRMRVAQTVRLLVSASTTTPITWGARRPVILLPESTAEWSDTRRRAVLRHELAHIARGDAHARWLAAMVCVLYWFHPLAWFVARALRTESEAACDDQVLACGMAPGEYAEHLLAIARDTQAAGPPGFLAARMASQPQIARRILALLDDTRRRRMLAPRLRAAAACGGTMTLLALAACRLDQRAQAQESRSIAGERHSERGIKVVAHGVSSIMAVPRFELETTPVAATPSFGIGEANDLQYVRRAVLLADGRIAAFRLIGPTVFIFDATGGLQRRIGKLGTQPGEFMSPSGMALLQGDTLWLPDKGNARVNWITADDGFVRTAPLATPNVAPFMEPRGRLRGGELVLGSGALSHEMGDSIARPATPIVLTDASLTDFKEIASVPGFEMVRITSNYRGRNRSETVPLRLGRNADVAAWDTLIAVATGENGYEIEQRDRDGTVVGLIRLDQPPRSTTAEMRAAVIAGELAHIDGPRSEAFVDVEETRRQARENPFADSLPPYTGIFATQGGTLWVVDAIAPGDSSWSATAFRADGAIVGRLEARTSGVPMYFGDDRVLVRDYDARGRVSLRVYRMMSALGRPGRE